MKARLEHGDNMHLDDLRLIFFEMKNTEFGQQKTSP